MGRFSGYKCAACGGVLSDNDDVVVCPECGAPHHRECYMRLGKCAVSDSHGAGYEPQKSEELLNKEAREKAEAEATRNIPPRQPDMLNAESIYRYGGVNPEDSISGVPVKKLAEYVGPSSGTFIRKWKISERGGGASFNFSAFFLGPYYYLYRKMWAFGFIYLAFTLIASIPNAIYTISEIFGIQGDFSFWYNASTVFSFISFIVRALAAIFFNGLYLSRAGEDIESGRMAAGGISIGAVMLALFITVSFSFFLSFIILI